MLIVAQIDPIASQNIPIHIPIFCPVVESINAPPMMNTTDSTAKNMLFCLWLISYIGYRISLPLYKMIFIRYLLT